MQLLLLQSQLQLPLPLPLRLRPLPPPPKPPPPQFRPPRYDRQFGFMAGPRSYRLADRILHANRYPLTLITHDWGGRDAATTTTTPTTITTTSTTATTIK